MTKSDNMPTHILDFSQALFFFPVVVKNKRHFYNSMLVYMAAGGQSNQEIYPTSQLLEMFKIFVGNILC